MMRMIVVAGTAIVLLALAGCAPDSPSPATTSTPGAVKPTKTATATPTPTPTTVPVADLVIPGCEELMTVEQAKGFMGSANTQFIGEFGPDDFDAAPELDIARRAADPMRLCVWGIPNSDGAFSVTVGSLAPPDRDALTTSLAAAGYTSVTLGTVTGMERAGIGESEYGGTHLFTGDLWIAAPGFNTSFTAAIAGAVLDSVRTANPTLGL